MRTPFERLMQSVARLSAAEQRLSLGEIGRRFGEPAERIADAIIAVRVMRGETTYVTIPVRDADGVITSYREFWWD